LPGDYRRCIEKFKEELVEDMNKSLIFMQGYKEEANRNIEVVISNLERQITHLLKELHNHFQKEKEEIGEMYESIMKRLEEQKECEEFNEELEIIDKLINNTDQQLIQQITNKSLNDKYENKKSIIQKLAREITLVKIRVQNLINNYNDKERFLVFDSQYSFDYLSRIQLNEIMKIKDYEQELKVMIAEVFSTKEESNKLKEEIKTLIQ
jgi:hypothetical protein